MTLSKNWLRDYWAVNRSLSVSLVNGLPYFLYLAYSISGCFRRGSLNFSSFRKGAYFKNDLELSCLVCKILAREGCQLKFSPTGGGYLGDGLMVHGKDLASAKDKQLITILKNELVKKAERQMHMSLVVTEITIKKKLAFY